MARSRSARAASVLTVGLALASGCGGIDGRLLTSGSPFGQKVFEPDRCRPGAAQDFYGVILESRMHHRQEIHIVREPDDTTYVRIKDGSDLVELSGASWCDEFDVDFWYEDDDFDDDDDVVSGTSLEGHVNLSCGLKQGGEIWGRISFWDC